MGLPLGGASVFQAETGQAVLNTGAEAEIL